MLHNPLIKTACDSLLLAFITCSWNCKHHLLQERIHSSLYCINLGQVTIVLMTDMFRFLFQINQMCSE